MHRDSLNLEKNEEMEKYDFETMNKAQSHTVCIIRNGWTILMRKMLETGATYNEFPPSPEFYKIVKNFYPNGMLKSRGKITGSHLSIGVWQYYDEEGNLTKEVDEDKKFGRIKLDQLLKFIEKEGHINLETGEGREYALMIDGKFSHIMPCIFSLNYDERGEKPFWIITIGHAPWNGYHRTIYHIDKETGEVLFKESEFIQIKKNDYRI
jgi:hypothetical protein